MNPLPHELTHSLVIRAPRELVFCYFTDSARFAIWWGEGSTIEGRVGGEVCIRYPNDIVARGEVTAIEPGHRIAFTYGYENAHPELPPGSSEIVIELHDDADGTRLEFCHRLPDEKLRDQHVPGWRYHLAVFANVTANEHHGNAATIVDQWFDAFAEQDPDKRMELLANCAAKGVTLRDPYACLNGLSELHGHISNTLVHMPGIRMQRSGQVRHCQGTMLVDWSAADDDGTVRMQGCNVVTLDHNRKILTVTGFAQS